MTTVKKKRAPLTHYAKAIVAFLGPTLTNLVVQLQKLSSDEFVNWSAFGYDAAIYLLTAMLVWAVPNKPPS